MADFAPGSASQYAIPDQSDALQLPPELQSGLDQLKRLPVVSPGPTAQATSPETAQPGPTAQATSPAVSQPGAPQQEDPEAEFKQWMTTTPVTQTAASDTGGAAGTGATGPQATGPQATGAQPQPAARPGPPQPEQPPPGWTPMETLDGRLKRLQWFQSHFFDQDAATEKALIDNIYAHGAEWVGPNGERKLFPLLGTGSTQYTTEQAGALGQRREGVDAAGNIVPLQGAPQATATEAQAGKGYIERLDPNSGVTVLWNPTAQGGQGSQVLDPQGNPIVTAFPDRPRQQKQLDQADENASKAADFRRLADEFHNYYSQIAGGGGAGADTIQDLRKIGQRIAQTFDVPLSSQWTDSTSGQEAARYVGQQLAAAAAKDISSKAAFALIQQINQIKMSPEMTPQGVNLVHQAIRAATQIDLDKQAYLSKYYNSPEGRFKTDGETQFNARNRPESYSLMTREIPGHPGSYVPPEAIEQLRANPKTRAQFDATFGGPGMPSPSSMVLGQ